MAKEVTNEDLAVMIKNRFDAAAGDLSDLKDELKTDISRIEAKVDKALHVEYVSLEVRVKRLEQKVGLKPLNNPA
ncbi:MAG: hypothetical protein A3E98_02645 [Candidatus Doudnabacteria bacterium RIFCSPHIGHO2_12_FULL_48_11]|uniref:Uncharacterized protein n=1 Tax=Candidatus Doudnabacteria bacterium RIFCSPHIGHO2_01_FULL_46_24 TaxID=1817825 RepID=A0A1F5NT52_9BACT|nr:MAG: hypothetical protein A2720_04305 [Candidatus Doudnabacteria bacterium RIFCSPHIGHO2_01_FULL_46_24]OGE94130.1 MAG: hypothetical protein A3E98_02645 [Candidatus Doudnabacteria bacterium RIFCSPHIGHO2_12_FULL_48_11]